MKNIIRFTLVLLVFFTNRVHSQESSHQNNPNYAKSVHNFEKYITKYYQPDKHQIKLLCENSCIFIRFRILKSGKISDLSFSRNTIGFSPQIRNTPPVITDALIRAFKKVESNYSIVMPLQSDDITYLLPFVYYYNSGCYELRKDENAKLTTRDTTYKIAAEEQQGNAILNMLNFADKTSDSARFTILKPIQAGKKNDRLFF